MSVSANRGWTGGKTSALAIRLITLVLAAIIFAGAALAQALTFPTLTGRVVDEAGLLGPADRAALSESIAAFEAKTGDQFVVVTLNSLRGLTVEDYGYQLGRHWGIGTKDINAGVLLIVAPKERVARIEVGYGLEGTLTDAATRLIIEAVILPRFRAGDFADGIRRGAEQIMEIASAGAAPKPVLATPAGNVPTWPVVLAALAAVSLLIYCAISGGAFCQFIFQALYMMALSGGGGGGRSSGGGSSYTGGGGSFGGGGSSGRW